MTMKKPKENRHRINTPIADAAHYRIQHACKRFFEATGLTITQDVVISECILMALPPSPEEPPPPVYKHTLFKDILGLEHKHPAVDEKRMS